MIIQVLLGVFIATTIVLLVMLISSLKREAILNATVEGYEQYFIDLRTGLEFVVNEIKAIDLKGSFESDDEVGIVFKAIANMITSIKVFIVEDTNVKT